jgi:hypothetical protein
VCCSRNVEQKDEVNEASEVTITKGQRQLLKKTYFTPNQTGSFTSALALRKSLLKKQQFKKKKGGAG